ncbi:MAG: FtsX-like permease family protein, partial [Lachnospiraceae bacterium]
YGPTLNQVWQVSILVKMVSSLIILLVIMMFVRMMIANQRNMISIKKAMGFRSLDIRKSFWKSCVPYTLAGIILGTICGCTLGERICGAALKSLGAEGFRFTFHMWSVALDILVGVFAVILAVYLGSNGIKSIKAVECCRGGE